MKVLPSPEEREYAAERKGVEVPLHEIVMWLFIVGALALLAIGFSGRFESAVQEASIFAASGACGIIARIAQAGAHHDKLMREIQKRQ